MHNPMEKVKFSLDMCKSDVWHGNFPYIVEKDMKKISSFVNFEIQGDG